MLRMCMLDNHKVQVTVQIFENGFHAHTLIFLPVVHKFPPSLQIILELLHTRRYAGIDRRQTNVFVSEAIE